MEVDNGVKVVLASNDNGLDIIEGTQETALGKLNVDGGDNDKQLNDILHHADINSTQILRKIKEDTNVELIECDFYNPDIKNRIILPKNCSLSTYLNIICYNLNDLIICMSVKDTAENYWETLTSSQIIKKIKPPRYRQAYSSIIDYSNNVVVENTKPSYCLSEYCFDNALLSAVSYGYSGKQLSYFALSMNGKREVYCFDDNKENRGLHMLIFSKSQRKIIDFIRIDMHKDPFLIVNR